jgi:hypothetical protein
MVMLIGLGLLPRSADWMSIAPNPPISKPISYPGI